MCISIQNVFLLKRKRIFVRYKIIECIVVLGFYISLITHAYNLIEYRFYILCNVCECNFILREGYVFSNSCLSIEWNGSVELHKLILFLLFNFIQENRYLYFPKNLTCLDSQLHCKTVICATQLFHTVTGYFIHTKLMVYKNLHSQEIF